MMMMRGRADSIQRKIVVIDDDPEVVKSLSLILTSKGYHVIPATSALEGMGLLANESPDLVILDIRMPRLDGFEFLRSLRQSLKTKDLPVIIASALSDGESRLRAKEMGAVHYLVKPYEPEELLKAIQTLVG